MKLRRKEFLTICILLVGLLQVEAQEGTLAVTGDITMSSSATYESHIKDLSGAGTGHDQITSSGDLTLDGTLDIVLNEYSPSVSDHFEVMTYGGALSGTFSTINWPPTMTSQGWLIDYGVISPGTVTIYGSSSVLPVELVKFSVSHKGTDHQLTWQTASEYNSEYFSIEHSQSGTTYESLDKVQSNSNSQRTNDYSWVHNNPSQGYHYYRLQQVDLDGKYEYSEIVGILNSNKEKGISYYPNPAKDIIQFREAVNHVEIYNMSGQLILDKQKVGNELDISSLPVGNYLITINQEALSSQPLIKQ
jgi:hypothetical protein